MENPITFLSVSFILSDIYASFSFILLLQWLRLPSEQCDLIAVTEAIYASSFHGIGGDGTHIQRVIIPYYWNIQNETFKVHNQGKYVFKGINSYHRLFPGGQ